MAVVWARRVRLTPHTTAPVHSPNVMERAPRCAATRDDEQAVSMLRVGPLRLKQKASRPDATLKDAPDAVCDLKSIGSLAASFA
jgi:hypothetical protein